MSRACGVCGGPVGPGRVYCSRDCSNAAAKDRLWDQGEAYRASRAVNAARSKWNIRNNSMRFGRYQQYLDGEEHRIVTVPGGVERLRDAVRNAAVNAGLKLATHKDGDNALIVQVIGKRETA